VLREIDFPDREPLDTQYTEFDHARAVKRWRA
jgi:hypothetical protein